MAQGSKRKWLVRGAVGVVLVVAVIGFWAGMKVTFLKTQLAAYQLRSAVSDEERTKAADRLVNLGTPGLEKLILLMQSGDSSCRFAATDAVDRYFAALTDGDQRAVLIAGQVLEAFPKLDEAGRKAVPLSLPELCRAVFRGHGRRGAQTLQGEASYVCGRGALCAGASAGID